MHYTIIIQARYLPEHRLFLIFAMGVTKHKVMRDSPLNRLQCNRMHRLDSILIEFQHDKQSYKSIYMYFPHKIYRHHPI